MEIEKALIKFFMYNSIFLIVLGSIFYILNNFVKNQKAVSKFYYILFAIVNISLVVFAWLGSGQLSIDMMMG